MELWLQIANFGPTLALEVVTFVKQAHVLAEGMKKKPVEAAGQTVALLGVGLLRKSFCQLLLHAGENTQRHMLLAENTPQRAVQLLEAGICHGASGHACKWLFAVFLMFQFFTAVQEIFPYLSVLWLSEQPGKGRHGVPYEVVNGYLAQVLPLREALQVVCVFEASAFFAGLVLSPRTQTNHFSAAIVLWPWSSLTPGACTTWSAFLYISLFTPDNQFFKDIVLRLEWVWQIGDFSDDPHRALGEITSLHWFLL